jgi:hypothetical protein
MIKFPLGGMFDFNGDGDLDLEETSIAMDFFDAPFDDAAADTEDMDIDLDDPDAYYGEWEEIRDILDAAEDMAFSDSFSSADTFAQGAFEDSVYFGDREEDNTAYFTGETKEHIETASNSAFSPFSNTNVPQTNHSYTAKGISRKDYPNDRSYQAACLLLGFQKEMYAADDPETLMLKVHRAEFILHADCIAAKYLTIYGQFLYAQAAKDNFSLPIEFSSKNENDYITFRSFLQNLSKEKPVLAAEIWIWVVKSYTPYCCYFQDPDAFGNDILLAMDSFHPAFLDVAAEALAKDETFRNMLLEESPSFPYVGEYIVRAIQETKYQQAAILLESLIKNPHGKGADFEKIVLQILHTQNNHGDPGPWFFLKDQFIPILEKRSDETLQRLLPSWKMQVTKELDNLLPKWERTQRHLRQQKIQQKKDDTFTLCGVMLSKGQQIYYYLTDDTTLSVGDKVLIPRWDSPQAAKVVSISQYTKKTSPMPLSQAKYLIGRSPD